MSLSSAPIARPTVGNPHSLSWSPLSLDLGLQVCGSKAFAQFGNQGFKVNAHNGLVGEAKGARTTGGLDVVVAGAQGTGFERPMNEKCRDQELLGSFRDAVRHAEQNGCVVSHAYPKGGEVTLNSANPRCGVGLKLSSPFPVCPSSSIPEVCLENLALDREDFLSDHALICRFSRIWLKLCDLHAWVSEN